jgi:hypothetical protein
VSEEDEIEDDSAELVDYDALLAAQLDSDAETEDLFFGDCDLF